MVKISNYPRVTDIINGEKREEIGIKLPFMRLIIKSLLLDITLQKVFKTY